MTNWTLLPEVRRHYGPHATMDTEMSTDRTRVLGYRFKVSRSKHFAVATAQGGVDFERLRIWHDGQTYARDRRRWKAEAKRARAE